MPRFMKGAFTGGVLPPKYGGTGVTSLANLKAAMALVDATQLGAADGYATLTTGRKIPSEQLTGLLSGIIVFGPTGLLQNASGTFTIKNYDDSVDYSIVPNSGTLTRVKDVITYTPSLAGARGFTINGVNVPVTVGVPGPIGSWGVAESVPAGAVIASSSSPGSYRSSVFGTAGGRVTSASVTQPADLPAGVFLRVEPNVSEGFTGVYAELQGTMPGTDYTGIAQLTVTTEAQPGDNSPAYPVGTQTQPITVSIKRRYFSFFYNGSNFNGNTGQNYNWDIAGRNLPNNEIGAPYQTPIEVISGSLPPGMAFNNTYANVGVRLEGACYSPGNYSFTIRLKAPTGWTTNPGGVLNATQDMSFNVSITTPIPDNETLLSTITSYKLASGTKTFRVLKNNTGSVPNPYEWKRVGDGSMAAVDGWNRAGVAPGDGHGYIDVTQTPSAPLQPNVYTNIAFTYNNNQGAFFSSTGVYLEVFQAHFTMNNLGPSFAAMRRGQSTYRNLAECSGMIGAASVQLLSGTIPPGMSLDADGLVISGGDGVKLVGTPTTAGSYNFTYRVTGGSTEGYHFTEGPVDFTASVQVTEVFTIQTGISLPNSGSNQFICAMSNTGNYTSGSASLPSGCTFQPNIGAQDARITVPAGLPPGTYTYSVTLATASGGSDTQSGSFTVTGPPSFNSLNPTFNFGVATTKPALSHNYGSIASIISVNGLPAGASVSVSGGQVHVTTSASSPVGSYSVSGFITTNTTGGGQSGEWYTFPVNIV